MTRTDKRTVPAFVTNVNAGEKGNSEL
jgi:hypothetical protein